jgi:hypothetical protein
MSPTTASSRALALATVFAHAQAKMKIAGWNRVLDLDVKPSGEHAEQNKDATPSIEAKIGRPGRDRAKVLSVRLNAKEYEKLTAQAELAGVGPSTLARSMILDVLNPSEGRAPIDEWVTSVSERLLMLEAKIGAER